MRLRWLHATLIVQAVSAQTAASAEPASASIPPRAVGADGWYTDLSANDYQTMSKQQIQYNTLGDVARNVAPGAVSPSGAGEAAMQAAAMARDQALEATKGQGIPQASPQALTQLAKDYESATNANIDAIGQSEDYVTSSRAQYNDIALCVKGLLICSTGLLTLFSSTKSCSNNVIDPSSVTGLRSVNIVEVKCENGRAQITNRWPPAAYGGPEIGQIAGERVFQGIKYSNYCVKCR
jgi:hypothetical protein